MAMANPPPTESGMPSRPAPRFGDIARVCSGNFLEMYDFMVFAYYAPSIAHAFFPAKNAFASLMLTLMTFGAGYLMRPLGAVVLGAYTDRMGRRAGLILTLLIMSIGTAVLAVTPGYATIGLAAPLLVLAGRLMQGLSAGVELGGVSVYLAEIAPEGRRGFYVSWQSGSQQLAVAFAAGLGVAMNRLLPPAAVDSWGWRIPFVIGCAIVPALFLLRRSLKETDAFLERRQRPDTAALLKTLAAAWPTVLAGMLMVTMTTVTFYVCTAYTPTLARHELHLDAGSALLITLMTGVSNFVWLPIMGTLSDRVGRRPCLLAFTVLGLLTAYPLMQWVAWIRAVQMAGVKPPNRAVARL
jgi:MHS family citrate/tricarballylate:H+ symporter-like MFS transporter